MTDATSFPWLTVVVFLPLVGAGLMFLVPMSAVRLVALVVTVATFLFSIPLGVLFDPATSHMQFTEQVTWITSPPVSYSLGLDGISLPLFLMTTFLLPLCVLASWRAIETRVREFMAAMLVMETAMLGVFAALDFVLFYVFWEVMLIPMYLLIGVWGGPERVYAAIKFFLYTLAGSVLLLIAILTLFFQGGRPSIFSCSVGWNIRQPCNTGCSGPSSSRLPSRCPCFPFIPGCRTRMWKRRQPAACSWPASC